jgi:hypothetical protein
LFSGFAPFEKEAKGGSVLDACGQAKKTIDLIRFALELR